MVEVHDRDVGQVAEGQSVGDDLVGALVVDVDLGLAPVAGHDDRLADRIEPFAHRIEVEAAVAVGPDEVDGLVAVALVGMGDEEGDAGGPGLPGDLAPRPPDHLEECTLEEAVEPLAAGVDHPGLAEDRQQGRRPGHRPVGRVDRGGEDGLDVGVALGGRDGGVGRFADDGEDRPLDRLAHRLVGPLGAGPQGEGEVEAREAALRPEPVGHPAEDLAGDDPGVAAGAVEGSPLDGRGDGEGGLAGHRLGLLEGPLDGRQHVRPGVTVGDGKDVEGVDLLDVRLEVGDRTAERGEETGAVARTPGHAAPPIR